MANAPKLENTVCGVFDAADRLWACDCSGLVSRSRQIGGKRCKVLRRAVELGVRVIDNGVLRFRRCHRLIAEALRPYPDDLVLATKIGDD